jgi:protease YdgD
MKPVMALVAVACAAVGVSCAQQPARERNDEPPLAVASIPSPPSPPVAVVPRAPLSAIGRINRRRGGFCSGVLIAPDRVLTTAHCLWDVELGRWTAVADLHFQAGYHLGNDLAHRRGAAIEFPAGIEMTKRGLPRLAVDDWAILTLDHPIAIESTIRPVELARLEGPLQPHNLGVLLRAGYGPRQPHALASARCKAVTPFNPSVLLHDCGATFAEAGFPILIETPEGWRALGLQMVSLNTAEVQDRLGMALLVNVLAGQRRTVRR